METTSVVRADGDGGGGHVLLLAFPEAQGHLNPMLQLGRRLAYYGLRPTLVTTRHLLATVPPPLPPFRVAAISDGFDDGGMAACPDFREYVHRLAAAGSKTLEALFLFEPGAGRPVRVLVYDPHLPWAGRVVRAAGVPTAALLSQPCSVDVVYGEVYTGRVGLSVVDRAPGPAERRPGTGGRAVVRGGAGVVPCVTGRGGRAVRWVGGRRRRVRQLVP